jgi:FAD/FMN-containing dehydrogenase
VPYRKSRLEIAKEEKIASWSKVPDSTFAKYGLSREKAAALELEVYFKLVWAWDSDYHTARKQYDPAYSEYPLVVGYAQTPTDVAWLLELAQAFKVPVSCRSGGHNTAGYAVLPGGVVVDMSGFAQIHIDPVKKLVTVGPGVNFGNLNKALGPYNLHTPGGDCLDVCIGGYMQGGGYGLTSREFGMNCDNVTQFTMMTYDSKGAHIVVASSTQNVALFWAVRGGTGNNFGVLLDVTYKLYPLGDMWGFGVKWTNLNDAPAALEVMQNAFTKTGASPKVGYMAVIMVQEGDTLPSLAIYGLFDGTRAQGLAELKPILATTGAKLVTDRIDSYQVLNATLFPNPNVPQGVTPPPPEFKQSAYIEKPIPLAGWTEIVKYYGTRMNDVSAVIVEPYGGAINSYGKRSRGNAFIHRNVYMDLFVDAFFLKLDQAPAANAWLDGYMKIINPLSNGQQYQNYPRRDTADYPKAFWGDAYPVLQQIKIVYDPLNVFKFPMGINPPSQDEKRTALAKAKAAGLAKGPVKHQVHFEQFKKQKKTRKR